MNKKASLVLGAMALSAILWPGSPGGLFAASAASCGFARPLDASSVELLPIERPTGADSIIRAVARSARGGSPPRTVSGDSPVKLITPTSTVEKGGRTEPPVAETEEVDVETPLGQVQSVLDALRRLEDRQENLTRTVDRLRDVQPPCPVDRTDEVLEKVDALRLPDLSGLAEKTDLASIGDKVEEFRATLADAIAKAESIESEAQEWRQSLDRATAAVEKLAEVKNSKATQWLCGLAIGLFAFSLFVRAFRAVADKLAEWKRYAEAYRQYQAQQNQKQISATKEG